MGSNDTAEQLKVCHEVNVENEARIADLGEEIADAATRAIADAARITQLEAALATQTADALLGRDRAADLERERDALLEKYRTRTAEFEIAFDLQKRQIAELERENVRLETALADRMRTDAHGPAALEAELRDSRARLARIFRLVDPRRDDPTPLPAAVIRRILDDLTAEPEGAYLEPDDAHLAAKAIRGLAGIIRATSWNTEGDQAHGDADRLDQIADRIGAPA